MVMGLGCTSTNVLGVQVVLVAVPPTQINSKSYMTLLNAEGLMTRRNVGSMPSLHAGSSVDSSNATFENSQITAKRLLEILECENGVDDVDQMDKILAKYEKRFFDTLSYWKEADPKRCIEVKTLKWRDKNIETDSSFNDFLSKLSQVLYLDQIQTYEVFHSYIQFEFRGQSLVLDDHLTNDVFTFYREERLSIIKCVCCILCNSTNPTFPYYNQFKTIANKLISKNFNSEILDQFTKTINKLVPGYLSREVSEIWAMQYVLEQIGLLQILFLLYYSHIKCSSAEFISLAKIFAEKGFGSIQANYFLLTSSGRALIEKIGHLKCLIIIECLYLENYMKTDRREISDFPNLSELEKIFKSYNLNPIGPIYLSWYAILQRKADLCGEDENSDKMTFFLKAMELNAFDYLHDVLKNEFNLSENINMGYRSVVRGLLNLLLVAFPEDQLTIYTNELVKLHQDIFINQQRLSQSYFEHDIYSSSLKILLDWCFFIFPFQFEPLLRMLMSLVNDEETAAKVFENLTNLKTYKSALTDDQINHIQGINNFKHERYDDQIKKVDLNVNLNFLVKDSPNGLLYTTDFVQMDIYELSPNTIGCWADSSQNIIIWEYNYSAWFLFFKFMDHAIELIKNNRLNQIYQRRLLALLRLFNQFFRYDPQFHKRLLNHLVPLQSEGENIDLLEKIVKIFQFSFFSSKPFLDVLIECFGCLKGLAKTSPRAVWNSIKNGGFDTPDQIFTQYDLSCIKQILDIEISVGIYKLTISFLDLIKILLKYLKRFCKVDSGRQGFGRAGRANVGNCGYIQALDSAIGDGGDESLDFDELSYCIHYIQNFIFIHYETWRYKSILDRWKIGKKILKIFEIIICNVPPTKSIGTPKFHDSARANGVDSRKYALKYELFEMFFMEAGFNHHLLYILSIGPRTLEFQRKLVQKGVRVEECVLQAFKLCINLLLRKDIAFDYENGGARPNLTDLEHSFLYRKFGKNSTNLIHVIASYISYNLNAMIPLYSTQLLTIICQLCASHPALSHVSMTSYFESQIGHLRSEYLWKLHDSREPQELRVAILQLITGSVGTQQGITEMFINFHYEFWLNGIDESEPDLLSSCIWIILDLVENKLENYSKNYPALLHQAFAFLETLWLSFSEHYSIITLIRNRPEFWNSIGSFINTCFGKNSSLWRVGPNVINGDEFDAVIFHVHILGYIFRIFSLEIFFADVNNPLDKLIRPVFDGLFGGGNNMNFLRWLNGYGLKIFANLEGLIEFCSKFLNLADFSVLSVKKCDYGANYFYDRSLLEDVLDCSDDGVRGLFFGNLCQINRIVSMRDSQSYTVKSFCDFIFTTFSRYHEVEWPAASQGEGVILETLECLIEAKIFGEIFGPLVKLLMILIKIRFFNSNAIEATLPKEHQFWGSAHNEDTDSNRLFTPVKRISPREDEPPSFSDNITQIMSLLLNLLRDLSTVNDNGVLHLVLANIDHMINFLYHPKNPLKFSFVSLIPFLLDLLPNRECLVCALSILTKISYSSDSNTLISCISGNNTFLLLSKLLLNDLESQLDPVDAYSIIIFFESCAVSQAVLADILTTLEIEVVLTNESWANFVSNLNPYLDCGKRNQWHIVWCHCIIFMTLMLKTLGYKEQFVEKVFQFVAIHRERIFFSLEFKEIAGYNMRLVESNGKSAGNFTTLASLEEMKIVTLFIYELAHYRDRWKLGSNYVNGPEISSEIEKKIFLLFNNLVGVLAHPANIMLISRPISASEVKANRNRDFAASSSAVADETRAKTSNSKNATASSVNCSFYTQVECSLYQVMKNTICIIRLLTPPFFGIGNGRQFPAFVPVHDPKIFSISFLKQLNLLIMTSMGVLNKIAKLKNDSNSAFTQNLALIDSNSTVVDLIGSILEVSMLILITHIHLYLLLPESMEPLKRKVQDEIVFEFANLITKLIRDWDRIFQNSKMRNSQSFLHKCDNFLKHVTQINWMRCGTT